MLYTNEMMSRKLEELSRSLLKGHHIFGTAPLNEARFSQPEMTSHNITYRMTEDRVLVEQYFAIRQEIYREVYNDPNVGEDYTDRISKIFVATAGFGNVIGGIRLTVSTPLMPNMLPIENSGVNLRRIFPKIDFDKVVIGEAGRSAVLPDYRNGEVCNRLQMISKEYFVKEMGAEIGFGCCDLPNMRRLKKFFGRLGYNFIAREDIRVANRNTETELYLWAIDFTADSRYIARLQAPEKLGKNIVPIAHVAELPSEFA